MQLAEVAPVGGPGEIKHRSTLGWSKSATLGCRKTFLSSLNLEDGTEHGELGFLRRKGKPKD